MFEEVVGNNGGRFFIAAAAVAAGLLLLVVVLWFMRNRASSPFVRGGKNRQPRLAVLDAAAVDTRRRLVLVRRDDVEHLIMIGGPTDIVIESRIVGAKPISDVPAAGATASVIPHGSTQQAVPSPAQRVVQAPQQPLPVAASVQEPARAAPERRPDQRPTQDPRPALPPVSGMGQALYGDEAIAPRANPTVPTARPSAQPVADRPQPPRAQQPAPPRSAAATLSAATSSPADILEAARSRVLMPPPADTRPPAPVPASAPVSVEEPKRQEAKDFERLLDAQISGDLGRLSPVSATPQPGPVSQEDTVHAEPRTGAARSEPSLEEEMNRMLNEMGTARRT